MAPGGAPHEAVAEEGGFLDPLWSVSVRQPGLLGREWSVGCVSGDDPADEVDRLVWRDAEHLEVRTLGGGTGVVTVDPATGEPTRVTGGIWGC